MKKSSVLFWLTLLLTMPGKPVYAKQGNSLNSPEPGVLCDSYICASGDGGVSRELTAKYLGRKTAQKLYSEGDFDTTEFTFANGIFCDTKERLCREDRYFGANGKPSGSVSEKYTKLLFLN